MVKLQIEIDAKGVSHIVKCEDETVAGVTSVNVSAGPQELTEVTVVLYARDCDISFVENSLG